MNSYGKFLRSSVWPMELRFCPPPSLLRIFRTIRLRCPTTAIFATREYGYMPDAIMERAFRLQDWRWKLQRSWPSSSWLPLWWCRRRICACVHLSQHTAIPHLAPKAYWLFLTFSACYKKPFFVLRRKFWIPNQNKETLSVRTILTWMSVLFC